MRIAKENNSPLYFLHLAKTAGTTFMSVLDRQFSQDEICPAKLWHQLLTIPTEKLSGYRCFRGHFYAYLDSFLNRSLKYITFLRDPVERTLSHYSHIARSPGHYFYNRIVEQDNFLAFLSDPATKCLMINYQVRGLALDVDPVVIASALSPEELSRLKLEQILDTMTPVDMSDDELLSRAKARLDQCLFVGLTEQYPESLKRISSLLGWPAIPGNMHLNVSEKRLSKADIGAEAKRLLLEQTYLDYELYHYAQSKFEKQ